MAILDFLTGGRGRRKHAAQFYEATREPLDRLHGMIQVAGVAQMGEAFEEVCARFVDCRILRTEELVDFPAKDRDALDRLVAGLLPAVRPVHAEVRAAFELVRRDWRHGGLVEAAAGGGLRALEALAEQSEPKTVQDRLVRIVHFMDVDVAGSDVSAELLHIAKAPSLFW